MDDLDFQILKQLQNHGRKPYTEIAKSLGVTEGTVRNRVSKLEADKIVQVIGLVDPHKVGLKSPALIRVSVQMGYLDPIVAEISTYPEVSYLLHISGDYDLLVEVMCRDFEHLSSLVTDRLHRLDGVKETHITPVLKILKVAEPDLDLVKADEKA